MNRRGLSFLILALLLLAAALALSACSGSKTDGEMSSTAIPGGDTPTGPLIPVPLDPAPSEYVRLAPGDAEFEPFLSGFSEFPLYWVGEEFGGHALRNINWQVVSPADNGVAQNNVSFLYGSCGAENLTDGGCPFPLSIVISPYCLVPPELVGNGTRPANMVKVRGDADALTVGGGLRIWTGDITIKIYASSPQLLEDATAAMVSPNGLGVTSAGSPLPAPDPDCSGYKMVPLHQG